jgi:hypothetical protein
MDDYLLAKALDVFTKGSQIHLSGPLLFYWGLPIIKLDTVYRGVFVAEDVVLLGNMMGQQEAKELKELLFSKAYGAENLFGPKRLMFGTGCI